MPLTPARDFGVQSYCFREFKDNRELAQLVRKIGVSKLEICAVHANFDDVEGFKKIVDIHKEAGVQIVSLGVQTFTGDVAKERKWFECAKAAGARHISAHFQVGTFEKAIASTVKLCDEFDMKVGIHCHGGYVFGGSADVLTHLLKIGGERIGVNIDTAWCMQTGPWSDPVKWVRENFKGRVYGVHYKDFVFDRRAKWTDVVVGTGNLDLPGFVKALDESGFNGMAVIEYEADPQNPVPALTECVKSMRAV
jgi:sugar phosphate isomerase/epimerase